MSFAVGQIITPFLFSSPRTSLSGRWVAARDSGKDSPIAQLYSCPSRTTLKNVSDFFREVDKVGESLPPWSCRRRLEATMMTLLPPFPHGREREKEREKMENGTREGGKGHSRRLVTRGGGGPRKGIQDDRKGCTEGRSDLGFPGGECAKHPVDKKPPSIPVQVSRCCIHPSHPLALPAMPERATIILFASLFLPHRSSSPPPPLFFRRRHHRISDCGVKNNFSRVTSFPFSIFLQIFRCSAQNCHCERFLPREGWPR